MFDRGVLKKKVQELTERKWDRTGIGARISGFCEHGIPEKDLDSREIIARKTEILDRVQLRGEEYEYMSHNCAKGSALAVVEEFGLISHMDMIKAVSPFPGFGMTGWICGGVTGGLLAIGLFFGSNDPMDYQATGRCMTAARKFIPRFEEALGTILCPKLHENVIFGRYMGPSGNQEDSKALFEEAKGYEKCALPPGVGARIAAQIIIESMEESQ